MANYELKNHYLIQFEQTTSWWRERLFLFSIYDLEEKKLQFRLTLNKTLNWWLTKWNFLDCTWKFIQFY